MRYDFRTLRTFSKFALILGLSISYLAWYSHPADAKKHGDDSGDDDSGDEDTGDDQGGKGDDSGGDEGGDDDNADDKDQPPVTAGGLFTLNTYPVRELARPLTMTKK